MRPVNLIPAEDRRGEHGPLRSGPLAYVVVAALVAVLGGVTAMVLTDNQISERESEVARLEVEDAAVEAKAQRLVAYTQFRALREQRLLTISSLADSRFDWERVMRELSLILPSDVWLTDLTASASEDAGMGEAEGEGSSSLRASFPGPALELNGCAAGQEAVAGLVTALKDIDGVTRVGVELSELSDKEPGEASGQDSDDGAAGDCRTRSFIAGFSIVAAFDAAPVPVTAEGEAEAVAPTETTETAEEGG